MRCILPIMLFSKRNLLVVGAVLLWSAVHLWLLRYPEFRKGPPFPVHSWAWLVSRLEFLGHSLVILIAVSAALRCISWERKPTYGDDGLLSLENAEKLRGSAYEVTPTRWSDVAVIMGELCLYFVWWGWIYKIL